jgi:hypothetical protein
VLHSTAITAALFVFIGVELIGKGIPPLST